MELKAIAELPEVDIKELWWLESAPAQRREFIRAAVHQHGVLELSVHQSQKFIDAGLARLPERGERHCRLTENGQAMALTLAKKDMAQAHKKLRSEGV